ncbi:transglycosylase domain-containing protein [Bacillus alkalicola]|nr:transglycosylase domain-containing protein [Bacillus alkalicola]
METTEEFYQLKTLHEVLDEAVEVSTIQLPEKSIITDSNGNVVSEIYAVENRINLSYEEIPQTVIDALLSAEDQSFFDHKGFDIKGISRALLINLESQSIEQGGSTVTQQLIRNLYLTHDQSYERKLSEILYAYQLERELTKEEILELYINIIYFQNGVYGFEAASLFYFNKFAKELNVAETAFLAAIPNNPTLYNPLKNEELTHKRKEWILDKMLETGSIDEDDYSIALEEHIELNLGSRVDIYPDYVTYIHTEFEQLIGLREGYTKRIEHARDAEEKKTHQRDLKERVEELLTSGIVIETALQPTAQKSTVDAVNAIKGSNIQGLQGASVVIDHAKNEIIAITGGRNYQKFDFHRGYQAYRQPGSAIKPLLVFAPYIEETGTNSRTVIDASPFSRNGYNPRNAGGGVYGNVPMETAFKHSYNTAAVRLLDTMSPPTGFSYLNEFEFDRLVEQDLNLPAALGGLTHGVTVLEMTLAYTTFSNEGKYTFPRGIRQVTDKEGNLLYRWPDKEKRMWSEETNQIMQQMLSLAITEGTGRNAAFSTSGYLGGKTGTTNKVHDLWFVGASNRYTTGLWLGKDQPASITSASSQHLHTKTWREIMMKLDH